MGQDELPNIQVPLQGEPENPRQAVTRQLLGNANTDEGFISQLTKNPFFTAGFGLAALGGGLAYASQGLRHGAILLRKRMLVNVEINIKDDSYPWFLHWMYRYQRAQAAGHSTGTGVLDSFLQKLTPRSRDLAIQTEKVEHSNGAIQTQFALIPGPGKHVLRYKNAFVWVSRYREEKSIDLHTGKPWETVTLTTLYSQRHILNDIFSEAHQLAEKAHEGKTKLYTSRGVEWKEFGHPRRKRPLDSVILEKGVKERIVSDVKDFLGSGAWYYDRGIPYRRGYWRRLALIH